MVYNHVARRSGGIVQKRIETLKIGQKMQDLPEELWHESFRYYVKEDETRRGGPNMRLIRLDPCAPSLTVTGFIFNKFVHPFESRYITVREAARLQGFPDECEIKGSLTSTQQQIGNAVPIPLAKAVFDQICSYAAEEGICQLTALSLFSGAGGMDIGAHEAESHGVRIKTKAAVDCWTDACATLEGYLGKEIRVVREDITQISDPLQFWLDNTDCQKGPDLVFGGPPCQAFSQAGKQKALADPRGQLIFEFLRFIEKLHPKYFVLENVSNIKSVNGGALLQQILNCIDALDYNVSADVLCAADYGAPQLRRRVIFIGTDKALKKVSLPKATCSREKDLFGSQPYKTVGEAFEGLPPVEL